MKSWTRNQWIVLGAIAFVIMSVVGFCLRFPPGPCPYCHKAIEGAATQWMIEAKADSYPNVRGDSLASLAILEQYFSGSLKEYAYVPGLRPDDPKDLVLMSLRSKTRFDWHGDRSATIFTPKRWMVLPPGITEGKCTEGGELLETSEFARRLRRTLEFLKEQQRPHWHEIVTEQTKFLQSLDK